MLVDAGPPPADSRSVLPLQRRMALRLSGFVSVPRVALGTLERHWTEDEMLARAQEAERVRQQEIARQEARIPLAAMEPNARSKAWARASTAANKRHLAMGVAGLALFSQLHYFRCASRPGCVSLPPSRTVALLVQLSQR